MEGKAVARRGGIEGTSKSHSDPRHKRSAAATCATAGGNVTVRRQRMPEDLILQVGLGTPLVDQHLPHKTNIAAELGQYRCYGGMHTV